MPTRDQLYRTLLCTSYVAAAVTSVISNSILFWGPQGYGPITQIAGYIGVPAFLAWVALAIVMFVRDRRDAWPALLGAPFALWTPIRILYYVVAVMAYQAAN